MRLAGPKCQPRIQAPQQVAERHGQVECGSPETNAFVGSNVSPEPEGSADQRFGQFCGNLPARRNQQTEADLWGAVCGGVPDTFCPSPGSHVSNSVVLIRGAKRGSRLGNGPFQSEPLFKDSLRPVRPPFLVSFPFLPVSRPRFPHRARMKITALRTSVVMGLRPANVRETPTGAGTEQTAMSFRRGLPEACLSAQSVPGFTGSGRLPGEGF